MNLALFDIDGTLTDTSRVDAVCYLRALEMEFGISGVSDDWSLYTHSSDPGIINQVFRQNRGRPPHEAEVAAFKKRFLELLKEAKRKDPSQFAEIRGAGVLLRHLTASPVWIAAMATGGWGVTARFKLEAAGLPAHGLPFASGDDAVSREDILRVAIHRAREAAGVEDFARIVSLGDGVWDLKAARALNLAFIGVGEKVKLLEVGAGQAVRDFRELAACLDLMEHAPRLLGID
jgi:phosphoglycolate phosphatase-like HAD superfamily hydrolase